MKRTEVNIGEFTTIGIGGTVELYTPDTVKEFSEIPDSSVVLGAGSNILFDNNVRFSVVNTAGLDHIRVENETVFAGAGVRSAKLLRVLLEESLSGAEFLSGIPGSVGGLVKMNAGAFGSCMEDILLNVEGYDRVKNEDVEISADNLRFDYRECSIDKNIIVTGVSMGLKKGIREDITGKIRKNKQHRMKVHPGNMRNFGSVFRNPPGYKAWELIKECGLSGRRKGDAVISEKHCNFILNCGSATFDDVIFLIELSREKVYNRFDITLENEVKIYK